MTDENGDTALHKAVQSRNQDVARMLVKEDPDFEFPSNKFWETPLYLEAESSLREALIEILNSSKQPNSSVSIINGTPLHTAVIQEHTVISLCEEPDVGGWNLLHFAALLGLKEVVSDKLGWKISLAYLPAGSENDWTTIIHIAAGAAMAEMLDSNGRNSLHEAILYSQANVVNYLLKPTKWDKLIENPDNNGNTPLHLLASSNFSSNVPLELKDHPRAKKMSYIKENKTPFDIAMSCTEWTEDKDRIVPNLYHNFFISIAQLGRCSPRLNQMDR
ncbi:serine/threonine-protein phosphatase 6 regulatory ankyrin repeat subunit B-like [Capsicum annuum]|uniref:serine/threonine-protein phosphatase 6 regulatory ankyrin repeat subunit B-like n=1 Tax=Capsicum annuum TaxID=4072 RepID=UPI0007BF565C|nr:serine/threonine-protein phosphatase 6 regulatory ankyrin repeat subunit B-like [Capsicum annuum]